MPKGEGKEKKIYTQEEMQRLLAILQDKPLRYRVFFYLLAYSGFRRGEMLGLEWKDINWENSLISVQRTSNYVSKIGNYTDETKTKKSQRTLKLPVQIMSLLRELKDEQTSDALTFGDKWVETDRLFTRWNGEPMANHAPYNWLRNLCKKEGLPFYGIHSFRHFTASTMISAGLDVTTVSGALGHSNSSTTLNIYSHAFETAQAKVCDAMSNALGFTSSDKAS